MLARASTKANCPRFLELSKNAISGSNFVVAARVTDVFGQKLMDLIICTNIIVLIVLSIFGQEAILSG
jgi:hypothetical protein